jgi:hypothetical protein
VQASGPVTLHAGPVKTMNTPGGSVLIAAGDGLNPNRGAGGSIALIAGEGHGQLLQGIQSCGHET